MDRSAFAVGVHVDMDYLVVDDEDEELAELD